MDYTLHQLKIFLTVTKKESITKAAEELFLTQPAVSIQLKNLQEQFSIPLTEVIGRQLYITDFGKEIAAAAEKIIEQVESINYKTLAYQNELTGKFRISVVSTGKYVMPYFLSDFMNQHKGVDLEMDVTNKSLVIESLEKNEVDFALVSTVPNKLDVNHINLMDNDLYLVGSPSLKQKDTQTMFDNFPLLYREEGSATRFAMEQFISTNHIKVFKKIQLTSNEAVKQAVIAGLGYSVMPKIGIKNEIQNGDIEIIPYKGLPVKTQWQLIWLKSKKLSPIAESFIEHINKNKESVIEDLFPKS